MPITCMLDLYNVIEANDVETFQSEFPDFYSKNPQYIVYEEDRLAEVLKRCAVQQNLKMFNIVLTLCSESEKEAAPLIWAAGGAEDIDPFLCPPIRVEHAQYALNVAIENGRLEHVKKLLEPAHGMMGPLQPLWLAIYHKNIKIFDYLLTTSWLPQTNVKPWEDGWDEMLIAAATYNFPECVPQLLAHGADPKAKNSLALQFAGGHEDHIIFDLLYSLSDLHEAIADMQRKLSNPAMVVSLNRIESKMTQDQKNSILNSIPDTNAPQKESKKI